MKWYYKMLIGILIGILIAVIAMLLIRREPEYIEDHERIQQLKAEIEIREKRIDSLYHVVKELTEDHKTLQTAQDKLIKHYEGTIDSITALPDDESVEYFIRRTGPDPN